MSATRLRDLAAGWRGVCLVAITYVYFLIFAQFAFLHRLSQLSVADTHLQLVMAAMAIGGIACSLIASLNFLGPWPRLRLQISLLICAAAAALTLLPLDLHGSTALAFLIGSSLGMLTVTLVSNLRLWIGARGGLWKVGLATGIGYFVCNVPALFTATPKSQAMTAALLCLFGIFAASKTGSSDATIERVLPRKGPSFVFVLLAFTALVWLDSAAFYIIQNTPSLKAGTWQGTLHLWSNGVIHFIAALASAFLLRQRGLSTVLGLAVLALSVACLLLHRPDQVVLASLFYPVGVSLYSVGLVAYPSFLVLSTPLHQRAFRAGLIYAVAGWFGSAMGIGMGQHLRQVPMLFVVVAASLILGPAFFHFLRQHKRETTIVSAALAIALCIHFALSAFDSQARRTVTAEERGRQVYIAEGCINCHSQYVRPGSADVLMWGPTETIKELRSKRPPLIGNRRQGPDLSQVGGRRSSLWLRAHLFNPREFGRSSFMPAYSYLFAGSPRGDDLVQYLVSLKSPHYSEHITVEQSWQPEASSIATANPEEGAHLYGDYCANCHEKSGVTRLAWRSQFKRLPPDLHVGPWLRVQASANSHDRFLRFARVVKFGIPGTDMPGHEYLSDRDLASISVWLNQTMVLPEQLAALQNQSGENR